MSIIKENLFFDEISTLLILISSYLNLSKLRKFLANIEFSFPISPTTENSFWSFLILRFFDKKSILFVVKLISLNLKLLFSILNIKSILSKFKSFIKFIFPSFNNPWTL